MNIAIAILGLAILILLHEAGHFFVARAVGMSPRRFYLGFPPALVKVKRKGIEYGVGAIPLGGYVKIPGMHRPAPSDVDVQLGPAIKEDPRLFPKAARVERALEAGDLAAARAALPELERAVDGRRAHARRRARRRAVPDRTARRSRRRRLLAPAHVEAHRRHLRRAWHEHPDRDRPASSSPT